MSERMNSLLIRGFGVLEKAELRTIAPVVLARIGAMDLVALCLKSSMEATVR